LRKRNDPWITDAVRLKLKNGISWTNLLDQLQELYPDTKLNFDAVRAAVRNSEEYRQGKETNQYPSSERIFNDGTTESSRILEMLVNKKYTPNELLKLHGFDPPEKWELVEAKSNAWNGMTGKQRNNELVELRQSTVRAKPKKDTLTLADIDAYMAKKTFKYDKPLSNPFQYDPNGEVLEIALPDFHGGLLAWIQETGADYDIHIAKDLFFKCLYDIVDRCKGRKFKQIIFATLGDLCHIDNDQQTTTKGTPQQADGRIPKITDAIMDMLIDGITILGGLAPVYVMYLRGNHDSVTGRLLMMAVCQAFKNDPNVTFDMSPNPQKHIEIGVNLIGFTHGDMAGKNMDKWLSVNARAAWGRCKYAEVHQGHTHAQKVKEGKYIVTDQTEDNGGVVVRTLPVICNASYWEHGQGYAGATKAMMCFVWNEKTGLREMWYSCV
jgi:hypothetical protein